MNKTAVKLRVADVSDARAILDIYTPYIEKTAITFECHIPSLEEFQARISNTLPFFPYIVAVSEDKVVGYCYAVPFHVRDAFRWEVEISIYLDMEHRGEGTGRLLYDKMEQILKAQHFLSIYASIAGAEKYDEYLTDGSIKFHEHMGFHHVASFPKCGYKFGRWYDLYWYEKVLGEHGEEISEPVSFEDIKDQFFPEV